VLGDFDKGLLENRKSRYLGVTEKKELRRYLWKICEGKFFQGKNLLNLKKRKIQKKILTKNIFDQKTN